VEEKHTSSIEARESFQTSLDEVVKDTDQWAAAVWKVADGRITLVKITTHKFPTGDMLTAVSQLANKFSDQQRAVVLDVPVPDPLPPASLDSFLEKVFVPAEGEQM